MNLTPSLDPRAKNDPTISNLFLEPTVKANIVSLSNCYKKYYKKSATISFLKQCIETETIPRTFRIRNEPNPVASSSHKERWSQGSKQASILWMNSSILEMEDSQNDLENRINQARNKLFLSLQDSEKVAVETYLTRRNNFIYQHELKVKANKFKHLSKQTGTQPTQKSKPNEQNEKKKKNRPGKRRRTATKMLERMQRKTPLSVVYSIIRL